MIVYLSIGSNIEPKRENILNAIKLIREISEVKDVSSLYETEPWGNIKNQDNFYNIILKCETNFEPEIFIKFLKEIEKKIGRVEGMKWGPREIDIDIILYEDRIINRSDLTIPHKYFEERGFVVIPLYEIDKIIVNPLNRNKISEIYEKVDKRGVKKIEDYSFKKDVYSEINENLLKIAKLKISIYDELDSTQKYLMENFELNQLVISKVQKKGRGRKNNEWLSEKGGLYFSFSVEPIDYIYFLPILTSYSIGKVLKKSNFNSVKIKIPNDVYLNNKKVCGVISESYFKGDKLLGEVIGVGLNVNQNVNDFPNEYLDRLTSLFIESKKFFFLDNIINLFFDEFKNNLDSLIKKDIKKILDELKNDFKIFEEPFYVLINNKREKVYGEKFIDDRTIYVKKEDKEGFEIPLHSIP
ncbi:MAG TPA: 2-amino-4-hydroxy-6-hydroxymethyldihydropteridine diphosphokinase [Caldisericia bacterium]|mgnify:FL=1|nr:2-amino-4-hydroxy-6-hydroxymethyldihydropteridine diphosphokinase [Caldisericia bacterium]